MACRQPPKGKSEERTRCVCECVCVSVCFESQPLESSTLPPPFPLVLSFFLFFFSPCFGLIYRWVIFPKILKVDKRSENTPTPPRPTHSLIIPRILGSPDEYLEETENCCANQTDRENVLGFFLQIDNNRKRKMTNSQKTTTMAMAAAAIVN